MDAQLLQVNLIDGVVPAFTYAVSALVFVVLVARRPLRRSLVVAGIATAAGIVIGFTLAWLIGDVWNAFDVTLTFVTRLWFALGIAGVLVALTSLWRPRRWRLGWWRAAVAGVSVLLFAFMASIGINADLGEFPTVGSAIGNSQLQPLVLADISHSAVSMKGTARTSWHPPTFMPRTGRVGTAIIPATASHFAARPAIVYLPPAALVANPPALPVLIMLGGQPGSPANVLESGQLPEILDSYARTHAGLAPIVVIPDQLGTSVANPMCLDSPLGNVATYLTVDVPHWITSHFSVLSGPRYWGIGGFSEGGTCAIQLGAKYPGLFGNILDVSGQVVPANGSVAHTVTVAFGGSVSAYRAAEPRSLLAAGAPFTDSLGIFGVGQNDAKYTPEAELISSAARAAGMDTHFVQSPGTAHDWYTVKYVIRSALPLLYQRWGLLR